MKEYHRKLWAGEMPYPCDDDCPEGCDGKHNYELPLEYPDLFVVDDD